jgi:hypothetical protein
METQNKQVAKNNNLGEGVTETQIVVTSANKKRLFNPKLY